MISQFTTLIHPCRCCHWQTNFLRKINTITLSPLSLSYRLSLKSCKVTQMFHITYFQFLHENKERIKHEIVLKYFLASISILSCTSLMEKTLYFVNKVQTKKETKYYCHGLHPVTSSYPRYENTYNKFCCMLLLITRVVTTTKHRLHPFYYHTQLGRKLLLCCHSIPSRYSQHISVYAHT